MKRTDAILAQYSHFKDMPWVEKTEAAHLPSEIILHADVIIETFKAMSDEKLIAAIPPFYKKF